MKMSDKALGAAEMAWYDHGDLEEALKAAAPLIAAQALRDALDEVDTMRSGPAGAPYVSATKGVLRSIADQWDGR